jgi:hypothetical protein
VCQRDRAGSIARRFGLAPNRPTNPQANEEVVTRLGRLHKPNGEFIKKGRKAKPMAEAPPVSAHFPLYFAREIGEQDRKQRSPARRISGDFKELENKAAVLPKS